MGDRRDRRSYPPTPGSADSTDAKPVTHHRGPGLAATPLQIEQALFAKSFRDYIPAAWPAYLPSRPFVPNWHIDAIADHLQAVADRQITKLVISIPPRKGKSSLTTVLWPTWVWTRLPGVRFVCGAYKLGLAIRDAVWSRRLIESIWYRERWGHVFSLTSDQNTKGLYENDRDGRRLTASVEAGTTGEGGDVLVMDDPLDIKQADSLAYRVSANDYHDQVWCSRLDPPRPGYPRAMVLIAQRTNEDDVSGHVLAEGGWEHLCLPEAYEAPPMVEVTCLGFRDPRTEEGEPIWPAQQSRADIEIIKARGAYKFATIYQQRPAPLEGGIFKRHWWRFWVPRCTCGRASPEEAHSSGCPADLPRVHLGKHTFVQEELPETFVAHAQSWDMNFRGEDDGDIDPGSSRVSGGVWSLSGAQFYLRERVNAVMGFLTAVATVSEVSQRWPQVRDKLVEAKANGPAVMATLRRKVGGFIPVSPIHSKLTRATSALNEDDRTARAISMQGIAEAGDVYLPHPALDPSIWDYIEEHALFPNGPHDDDVDMTSQVLKHLEPRIWQAAEAAQMEAAKFGGAAGPPLTTQEILRRQREKWLTEEAGRAKMTPKAKLRRRTRAGKLVGGGGW